MGLLPLSLIACKPGSEPKELKLMPVGEDATSMVGQIPMGMSALAFSLLKGKVGAAPKSLSDLFSSH